MKGLTQEELADKINKTVDTVSNIERGVFGVKIETLFDISEALEIELYDLFTDIRNIAKKPSKKINNLIQKISSQESEVVSAIEKIVNKVCKVVR